MVTGRPIFSKANADCFWESSDEKPVNPGVNAIGIELDTGKVWYFSGNSNEWKEFGWNAQ